MTEIISFSISPWQKISCWEKQKVRFHFNPKTQDIEIQLITRNIFLHMIGRWFGKKWGDTVVATQHIHASQLKQKEPAIKTPPHRNSIAIAPYDDMMRTVQSIWNDDAPNEKQIITDIWKHIIGGSQVKKWQRLKSVQKGYAAYQLELAHDAEGVHARAPGKVWIKADMMVQFAQNKDKKVIHFTTPGIIHRLKFFDFPLRKIMVEKGQIEIKYGFMGFMRNFSCSADKALNFWKDVTWEKPKAQTK